MVDKLSIPNWIANINIAERHGHTFNWVFVVPTSEVHKDVIMIGKVASSRITLIRSFVSSVNWMKIY